MTSETNFYEVVNLKHGSVLQFFENETQPLEFIFFQINLLKDLGDLLRSQTFGNIMVRFKEKFGLDGRQYAKNFMEYEDIRRKWSDEDSEFLELMNFDLCPFKSRLRKVNIEKVFEEKLYTIEMKNNNIQEFTKEVLSPSIIQPVTNLCNMCSEKCFYDIKKKFKSNQTDETDESVKIITSTHIEINEMDSIPSSPETSVSQQIDLLHSACISSGLNLEDS